MSQNTDTKNPREGYRVGSPANAGTLFRPAHPVVAPSVQKQIGQRLRQHYDLLAIEGKPLPDHFIEIIGRLVQAHPESRS